MNEIFLTILLGITSGFIGGTLGQSGAEFMLPGLLILGIVPDFKTAVGTIQFVLIFPISLLAAYEYYKRKQIYVHISLILTVCYFFFAYFGAKFAKNIPNNVLEYVCGFYFLTISLFFFWNAYTGHFGKK